MKKLLCISVFLALSACSNKSGGEYLGMWVNTKHADVKLDIVKNGENFLIKETRPSYTNKAETATDKIPAVLKNGLLEIQTGFGPENISHVKENDTLTMPGMGGMLEFKRLR